MVVNEVGINRYARFHPETEIIFWVDWVAVKVKINGRMYEVQPFKGIFRVPLQKLLKYLDSGDLHSYGDRRNDKQGNATASFLLDVNNSMFERLI